MIVLGAICCLFLLENMLKFSRQEREKMEDEERGDFSSSEDSDSDTWDGITSFARHFCWLQIKIMCTQFATMRTAESFGDEIHNVGCMGQMINKP
jgi:hypothetical protein